MVGVSAVDSYNVATKYMEYEDTYHALLCALSEETIDDDINSSPTRPKFPENWEKLISVPCQEMPNSAFIPNRPET